MKNNIKATKMQLAKKHLATKRNVSEQTEKVSKGIKQLSEQLKRSLRDRGKSSRAKAAKEIGAYVGIDLGDKKSNYCFIDAEGNIFAEGTLATTQAGLSELFSAIPKCRIAIEVGTHSPWICALLKSHRHEVIVANPRKMESI